MEELRKGYRIPTIDEFVKGFVYELIIDGYYTDSLEDFYGFECYEITEPPTLHFLDEIKRELKLGNIQVKI